MPTELPAAFFVAGAHALFSLACILLKERKGQHDVLGGLWISITALAIMRRSILLEGPWDVWFLRMLGYPAAYGPLAFLYARILGEARPLQWKDATHLIPFVILSFVTAVWGNVFAHHTIEASGPEVRLPFMLIDGLTAASLGGYALASLRVIQRHRARLGEYFSSITAAKSLLWLNALNWVFVLYLVPPTLYHAGLAPSIGVAPDITTAIFIAYLMMISLFIVKQGPIYKTDASPETLREEEPESPKPRYERSMLSEERVKTIGSNLLQLMESRKPYLDEDLDLSSLASMLQVTPHQLSQVLNLKIGKSFHTFVNEFRVREAEARLRDPAYAEYPIQRIALESGFNSKSSFHSHFRKLRGISPGEVRQGKKAAHP